MLCRLESCSITKFDKYSLIKALWLYYQTFFVNKELIRSKSESFTIFRAMGIVVSHNS